LSLGKNSLSPSNSCSMPSLKARKLKALKDEMNCNLSETCDNIESPKVSPTHSHRHSHNSTTYLPGFELVFRLSPNKILYLYLFI
jgi:hypothetical protein